MTDDEKRERVAEARKAQRAVYLATDEHVAEDLSRIIRGLADALEGTLTEPEWEYGITWDPYVTGDGASPQSYTGCETAEGARETGKRLAGRGQVAKVWRRPIRSEIRAVAAGPWEEIPRG